jgi:hypothetical protein
MILFARLPQPQSGAEQFAVLVFGALTIDATVNTPATRQAVLLFLTAQLCLAYAAAGVFKLLSDEWRRGKAIAGILGTRAYGNQRVYQWLSRSHCTACVLGWGVIVWEVAFPLALVSPRAAIGFMAVGFAFHIVNTVVMGLNNFLWAFCSAYPALLYTAWLWTAA